MISEEKIRIVLNYNHALELTGHRPVLSLVEKIELHSRIRDDFHPITKKLARKMTQLYKKCVQNGYEYLKFQVDKNGREVFLNGRVQHLANKENIGNKIPFLIQNI